MNILTTLAAKVEKVGTDEPELQSSVIDIINAVVGALGIVCVIVILIGGINYMTSAGDAGKVKKGKDTILYGVIGLVICVLSFAIVNFVIGNIINSGNSGNTETSDIINGGGPTK